ncbi:MULTISPECIES: Flp family type IVb pilin [unclassified Mesorhizobium]|uniref:Flp family type IVb pilin n=1 Tax=unclassified Mesorhizobium TaxID=325217 RepID=UPI0007FBF3C4|nr:MULTISPECIES: Flp family type IVb pilin [unclassified Mesorhizobium]OBQ87928.1 pilin [Mesorhizobium sp. WSM3873]RWI92704.1 MAG: Flp family type IVb pilin [Mesorhizobium sp.]TIQ07734.1 MAG: Flp family type IVb pilin [Mesorhizobium sp.]TIR22600.1 MAG: Flp family type IVb pilin [Mesorhizobium sp.]
MKKLMTMARQFRDDENGAAMVEYSILVGIIAGAAILAIVAIGLWVSGRFGGLCDILNGKGSTGTAGTFGTCVKGTGVGT